MTVGSVDKLVRIHGLGLPSSDDGPPLLSQSIGRHGDCSCDDDRDPVKVNMFQKMKEKNEQQITLISAVSLRRPHIGAYNTAAFKKKINLFL